MSAGSSSHQHQRRDDEQHRAERHPQCQGIALDEAPLLALAIGDVERCHEGSDAVMGAPQRQQDTTGGGEAEPAMRFGDKATQLGHQQRVGIARNEPGRKVGQAFDVGRSATSP